MSPSLDHADNRGFPEWVRGLQRFADVGRVPGWVLAEAASAALAITLTRVAPAERFPLERAERGIYCVIGCAAVAGEPEVREAVSAALCAWALSPGES